MGFFAVALENLSRRIFPEPLSRDLLESRRALAFDKDRPQVLRMDAVSVLSRFSKSGECYSLDEYLADLLALANDKGDSASVRKAVIGMLRYKGPRYSGDYTEYKMQGLMKVLSNRGDDEGVRQFALECLDFKARIDEIGAILRNREESPGFRRSLIERIQLMSGDDYCYLSFTTTMIQVAEDTTEDTDLRQSAMSKLHPEKHKDVLLALKNDPDEGVRRLAINAINRASLSRA